MPIELVFETHSISEDNETGVASGLNNAAFQIGEPDESAESSDDES